MAKIKLSEAHLWCKPSRAKTYEDANSGVLSTEIVDGVKMVDTAELQRVYGEIQNPAECPVESEMDADRLDIEIQTRIDNYESQLHTYKDQLEKAEAREQAANAEKLRLLDLADRLQKQNEVLMLPPPRKSGFWESIKKVFTPA